MKQTWKETLTFLRSGEISKKNLHVLSCLSREQAAQAWAAAGELSAESRCEFVQTLAETAEADFEVNFGEIFRLALGDGEARVRQIAVEGLWEDEDPRLVPLLATRLLEDSDAAVRAAAAASLGRFVLLGELDRLRERPHQVAIRSLLQAADRPGEEVDVRRRIVESLAYSGEEAVVALIRAAYQEADEHMRTSAVFAMGRSNDERWANEVMAELYSANPEMRYEAARACGELTLSSAVPMIVELVDDVDPEVQEAAIWALGQIGGDEARRVLEICARGANEVLRTAALEALREVEFLYGDLGAFLLFDLADEEFEDEDEFDEMDDEEDPW